MLEHREMNDPFDLQRFLDAQHNIYDDVLSELRQKRKTGHWMWFIFPQIKGLGLSPMSQRFAIQSLDEAIAYLEHPILGARLIECTQLLLAARDKPIRHVLGTPDDMKFRSSMTLFAHATKTNHLFVEAIDAHFDGDFDNLTLNLLHTLNKSY
jgi:uncharacterized protein (DUF1810 family)